MAEHADVPGAVAQQGEGLLGDGGEHQLALLAVGEDLAALRVDDLGDEVVLVDVHARLGRALEGHAGAGQLGEAVDVIGLDARVFWMSWRISSLQASAPKMPAFRGIWSGVRPMSFMVSPM